MTFERGRLEGELEFDHADPAQFARNASKTVYPVQSKRQNFYGLYGKRALDIFFVMLTAPVWATLVIIFSAIVMLDGRNPFYVQNRVGLNGRAFRMWKIRSMVTGAETLLGQYLAQNPDFRAEWDDKQKLDFDPRVTKVGKFLRKTSFDELPQFWNVLIGDMSMVGPRPMMTDQKAIYPGTAYYLLRPGVTGPWQISARNRSSFRERARYDEAYMQNCSLATDLRMILQTVPVVVKGRGV